MTTLPQASSFNVEASLNAWLTAALQAFARPQWLSDMPAVVENAPQTVAVMPCFSLTHIPVEARSPWEGRWAGESRGMRVTAILDASCWVSRSKSPDWVMQLRTMRDMLLRTVTNDVAVIIADYSALPRNTVAPAIAPVAVVGILIEGDDGTWSDVPLATAYKINVVDAALTAAEPDANPDVERARVLIDYAYVFRSS